jgi:hypothetical protein
MDEVPVIIPPTGRAMNVASASSPPEGPSDELAALEAGWDELLLA